MCRYSIPYKPHYACFECRKTFKRRLLGDIKKTANVDLAAKCPHCGSLTADMGLDFKSPKMNDVKSWNHLRNLFKSGVTFHSCGCQGPGYIPNSTEKLIEFLARKKADFIKQRQFWLTRIEPKTKQEAHFDKKENWFQHRKISENSKEKNGKISNSEAVEFWNEKISDIENKIASLISVYAEF
jgi:DNA-directed RNA polymerase subunit RPC12/RpoP